MARTTPSKSNRKTADPRSPEEWQAYAARCLERRRKIDEREARLEAERRRERDAAVIARAQALARVGVAVDAAGVMRWIANGRVVGQPHPFGWR